MGARVAVGVIREPPVLGVGVGIAVRVVVALAVRVADGVMVAERVGVDGTGVPVGRGGVTPPVRVGVGLAVAVTVGVIVFVGVVVAVLGAFNRTPVLADAVFPRARESWLSAARPSPTPITAKTAQSTMKMASSAKELVLSLV